MDVRLPAVAGYFYPEDAHRLADEVAGFIASARLDLSWPPKAVVAPHAGYEYAGAIAGAAYAALATRARTTRVVLVGPAHRVFVSGIAASSARAFRTPLGDVAVDTAAVAALSDAGLARRLDVAHANEHSLEVLLPFLQVLLPETRIVPLLVGDATADAVADVLLRFWPEPDTALVVSTDLSHYLSDEAARRADAATVTAVEALAAAAISDQAACGARPLRGLLTAARRQGAVAQTLATGNSAAATGDPTRVVGYAAVAVSER